MKSLLTVVAILFTFCCCTAGCNKHDETTSSKNNGSGNNSPSTSKMKITIGTAIFTATLYNNLSANALREMFPLAIDMTEFNGNEKYYDLRHLLPTNESVGGDIKAGDLMLYGNNALVLFYKDFNTRYSYTKLGYVDDIKGLVAALGNRNVVVKFEKI